MFSIHREAFDGIEKIKLFNSSTGEYLSIIPAYGGNLNELVLMKGDQLYDFIAGDKTLTSLSGKPTNTFRGAKLSPFPNRVKEGCYIFNSHRYHLNKNDNIHALHGLIWNVPFSVVSEHVDESSASLTIAVAYQSEHVGFPFHYRMEITYVFQAHRFSCTTQVVNESQHSIPIGDGWHPYFKMGTSINALKLKLPPGRLMESNESLIPTGRYVHDTTFEQKNLLGKKVLDDCFEIDLQEVIAETSLTDESQQLTLVLWQRAGEMGYRFVQLYTPPDRQSIAIEPMSCAPDAFNNKKGLIVLNPKESVSFEFGVRVE